MRPGRCKRRTCGCGRVTVASCCSGKCRRAVASGGAAAGPLRACGCVAASSVGCERRCAGTVAREQRPGEWRCGCVLRIGAARRPQTCSDHDSHSGNHWHEQAHGPGFLENLPHLIDSDSEEFGSLPIQVSSCVLSDTGSTRLGSPLAAAAASSCDQPESQAGQARGQSLQLPAWP